MSGCRLGDLWQLDIGQALFPVPKNFLKNSVASAFIVTVTHSRKETEKKILSRFRINTKVKTIDVL